MASKALAKAEADHRKWLKKFGLDPDGRSDYDPPPIDRMPKLRSERSVELSNGFAPVVRRRTAMELRYDERPEVREEIERKSMRIGVLYNKGNAQYVSDGDQTKYEGRTRK